MILIPDAPKSPTRDSEKHWYDDFIQTSETPGGPKRTETFLEFGDEGTCGLMNKYGQIIRITKPVLTSHTVQPYRVAMAEPRCLMMDYRDEAIRKPKMTETDGMEGDSEISPYEYPRFKARNAWGKYRSEKFISLLDGTTQSGFGLGVDEDRSGFHDLAFGYRCGRFPETTYTIGTKARVTITMGAQNGLIVQSLSLESLGTETVELDLLVDLSMALHESTYPMMSWTVDTPWYEQLLERSPEHCARNLSSNQWSLQNPQHVVTVALFCDGVESDISVLKDDGKCADGFASVYGGLFDKRKIVLSPQQKMTYSLVLRQESTKEACYRSIDFMDAVAISHPPSEDMWWQLPSGKSTILYRRTLENILSNALHFHRADGYQVSTEETLKPVFFVKQSTIEGPSIESWDRWNYKAVSYVSSGLSVRIGARSNSVQRSC